MIRFQWLVRVGLLSLIAVAGVGCQNKLYDDNVALRQQNLELQQKLTDAQSKLQAAPDPSQVTSMQSEIAARDAQIKQLQDQLRQPPPNAPAEPGIAGIETSYDPASGRMTVAVPGDVLFAPGDADIKETAKPTLDKIVAALQKDYSGKLIFVEGHTDSDPISRTKGKWIDNLDLSAARARTVADYLISHGISESQVGLRAFGSTIPKSTKAKSRRVEIVVATKS
jgi:flagellar motor protein MotB